MSPTPKTVLASAAALAMTSPGGVDQNDAELAADQQRVAELRAKLDDDTNDVAAFTELAEVVRRHGARIDPADPLTATTESEDQSRGGDLAIWSLAEELAGRPTAWYPLIELARLSVDEDLDGAMRRLHAACEREDTGLALAEAVWVLREAGHPYQGDNLATIYWQAKTDVAAAGRQIVLAAVEAGRGIEARRHLTTLAEESSDPAAADVVAELTAAVSELTDQA